MQRDTFSCYNKINLRFQIIPKKINAYMSGVVFKGHFVKNANIH